MKKLLILFFVFCVSCESDSLTEIVPKDQWTFVACEGNFGASNGSFYMINANGLVKKVENCIATEHVKHKKIRSPSNMGVPILILCAKVALWP